MLHESVLDAVFRLMIRYVSWLGVNFNMLCQCCVSQLARRLVSIVLCLGLY